MGHRTGRLTDQVAGEPARLPLALGFGLPWFSVGTCWLVFDAVSLGVPVPLLTGSPHAVSAPPPTNITAVVNAIMGRRSSMSRHYEHLDTGARRAAHITLLTSQ
jgi:hypothetical protein